jgi:hypothetical protein
MPFFSPETKYSLQETFRRVGIGSIVKLVLILGLFLWWIWPEEPPLTQPQTVQIKPDPIPPAAEVTQQDLRPLMTATQSSFYWKSFIWMMEHGKVLTSRNFEGKALFTRYIKDEAFNAENGLSCSPYSEAIIMAGKLNIRKGIACKIGMGSWCRQPMDEKAECRRTTPQGGLDVISNDYSMGMHNMKLEWNNKLSQFGF